jgi:hypothetical protein
VNLIKASNMDGGVFFTWLIERLVDDKGGWGDIRSSCDGRVCDNAKQEIITVLLCDLGVVGDWCLGSLSGVEDDDDLIGLNEFGVLVSGNGSNGGKGLSMEIRLGD